MDRLSIEPLSVLGMPPVEYVHMAADLGLEHVTLVLGSAGNNPDGFPSWSLRNDAELRRATHAAMDERGITISLVDGFTIWEGTDARNFADDIVIAAELGAPRVNTVSFVDDMKSNVESFAIIADLAAAASMVTTLEFVPNLAVKSLPEALEIVHRVDRSNFALLLDSMHLFRSGGDLKAVKALEPDAIQYIQLSDVPLVPSNPDYMDEAMFERMIPGCGELPLLDLLKTLPQDLMIGLEVPLRSLIKTGVGPYERMSRCIEATRALLGNIAEALP